MKSSWSVWQKFLSPEGSFDHVVVNTYSEFGQWETFRPATHKVAAEVHPERTMEEIREKFNATRTTESKELWKRLDIVKPPA